MLIEGQRNSHISSIDRGRKRSHRLLKLYCYCTYTCYCTISLKPHSQSLFSAKRIFSQLWRFLLLKPHPAIWSVTFSPTRSFLIQSSPFEQGKRRIPRPQDLRSCRSPPHRRPSTLRSGQNGRLIHPCRMATIRLPYQRTSAWPAGAKLLAWSALALAWQSVLTI